MTPRTRPSYVNATHIGNLPRERVAQLRADGVAAADIAKEAGVAFSTLYLALHDWHLVARKGGDRRSPNWRDRLRGVA